jgi:hypothetical protein
MGGNGSVAYKEGSIVGANIDDSLTMAEADIREGEQLEVV